MGEGCQDVPEVDPAHYVMSLSKVACTPRVCDSVCRVQVVGLISWRFRVWGFRFRLKVEGLGFKVEGLEFGVQSSGNCNLVWVHRGT